MVRPISPPQGPPLGATAWPRMVVQTERFVLPLEEVHYVDAFSFARWLQTPKATTILHVAGDNLQLHLRHEGDEIRISALDGSSSTTVGQFQGDDLQVLLVGEQGKGQLPPESTSATYEEFLALAAGKPARAVLRMLSLFPVSFWLRVASDSTVDPYWLELLFHSLSWVPLLDAMAANVASPASILVPLSHIVPETVMRNEGLPLAMLGDPTLLDRLEPTVRYHVSQGGRR